MSSDDAKWIDNISLEWRRCRFVTMEPEPGIRKVYIPGTRDNFKELFQRYLDGDLMMYVSAPHE